MILPTLRQLQYFLALSEVGSFREAADICHITQPTLSAAIAELESVLGQKLFERSTRKVTLTAAGHDMIAQAKKILADAEALVRSVQRFRKPLTGALTLGIIPTIAPYALPKLLPDLQSTYPELSLTLKEDITARQLDALKSGQVDVVLMAFPFSTPQMEQMLLWEEEFYLVRPKTNHKKIKKITLDDLDKETILLLDDGHCLRDHIVSACHLSVHDKERQTLGATSLQTLLQMVEHGYGATLLPHMAVDTPYVPAGVDVIGFSNPQPTRTIGLCWRKSDPRSDEFRLLGEFIRTKCA